MSVWAMATRGLGMSASAQRRSTTPCSSGACSGVTSLACMEYMAILSLNQYWQKISTKAMTRTKANDRPDGDEDADHGPVEHDQEEPGQQHPVGQAPVRLDVAGDGHQAPSTGAGRAPASVVSAAAADGSAAASPPPSPPVPSSALSAASSLSTWLEDDTLSSSF